MTETVRPDAVDPDALPEGGVVEGQTGDNLRWVAFKSTSAQIVGRGVIALARLAVVACIARGFGKTVFGQYALLFGILSVAEWIVDFGTVELAVREICRERTRQTTELRLLAALKLVQVPLAIAVAAVILLGMRYPMPLVRAGILGSLGVMFLGGVLVYYALFRARLTMERAVAAESLSVLAMIGLVLLARRTGGGLITVMVCHVVARGLFFATCFVLGRRQFVPSASGINAQQVVARLRSASTIGIVGSLMLAYEALDVILLSRLTTIGEVAHYSAAQRLFSPVPLACDAIAGTLYAVAAARWMSDRAAFASAVRRGIDASLALAGLLISSVVAGAVFFLGVLSRDLIAAQDLLQILGVLYFVKAVTVTIGPLLYVIDAQKTALRIMAIAAAVKALAIGFAGMRFGPTGVAWSALAVEITCVTVPGSIVLLRRAKFRLPWLRVALFAAVALIAVLAAGRLPAGPFHIVPGLAAPLIYASLVMAAGLIKPADVWKTLRNRA